MLRQGDSSATSQEIQQQIIRIALAALLHDVGKFAQRAEADPETYRTLSNLQEFAVTDPRGQVSYHHAAYTWQFIEDHLSWLTRVGNGDGNVAQWAARHHKPSTVWDWVVAEADRLSAGMDRGHLDEAAGGWATVQGARLIPLLARIGRATLSENFSLPMQRLAMGEGLFPQAAIPVSRNAAVDDYRTLFNQFAGDVDWGPRRGPSLFSPPPAAAARPR